MTEIAQGVEFLVVGLGAAGSAALDALARRGANVVGIDRYAPPHDMGSSHGETRMLRTAYSEGAAYVPMVRQSIRLWRELEARTNTSLFHQTGVLYAGPNANAFLESARESAMLWDVELHPEGEPRLAIPRDWRSFVDVEGGYIDAEKAIATLLSDAQAHGARAIPNCRCASLRASPSGVTVETSLGPIEAGTAIVALGAWAGEFLQDIAPVTHIERRVLHWFEDVHGQFRRDKGFRPFLVATEDDNAFYGFPANAKGEVKVAEHFLADPVASPAELVRDVTPSDIEFVQSLASRFVPQLGERVRSAVCMYPMSRDGHFIIDRDPRHGRIVIGAGLCGHGFKFAPVLGEALADLAAGRAPKIDAGFFSISRFAEFR